MLSRTFPNSLFLPVNINIWLLQLQRLGIEENVKTKLGGLTFGSSGKYYGYVINCCETKPTWSQYSINYKQCTFKLFKPLKSLNGNYPNHKSYNVCSQWRNTNILVCKSHDLIKEWYLHKIHNNNVEGLWENTKNFMAQ